MTSAHLAPARLVELLLHDAAPSEAEAEHLLECSTCASLGADPEGIDAKLVSRAIAKLRAEDATFDGPRTLDALQARVLLTVRRRSLRLHAAMAFALAVAGLFLWLGASRAPRRDRKSVV